MSEFGKQIIFKQLLDRHQQIQIPMIQRDFAQGRPTEEEVREEFLNALYGALSLSPDHNTLPLNLDFIYGSVEGEKDTRFLPLDGQQRLTTLFLLHWYLAWKDGCQEKFKEMLCSKGKSRFFYSVRPSSTEFFNALVNFFPDEFPYNIFSLKALITNQPWYFRYWRLDPTIQSSLVMLDSIHDRFCSSEGFFSRLVDDKQPAITFQLLDLEKFGLSDDLYIKMNARGKPLTVFETFKARYEQELVNQFSGETKSIGNQNFSVTEYFAQQMDTQWADFFWTHRDEDTGLFDDAVINLFRAVALITRDPESETYLEDISKLRNRWSKSSYTFFHSNGWLDRRFSEVLFMLLESWSKEGADFSNQLPDKQFFDEEALFAKIVSEPTSLGYTEIVQFLGYVVFMQEHAADMDADAFQEWMRVIYNLSVNTSYERPADMQRSLTAILKLAPNSRNILEYFAVTEKPASGFNLQQISEEKLKAELIEIDASWRPWIDRAESHGYFNGQIEFLLDFSGVGDVWRNSGNVDWGVDTHASLQKQFESYLKKAETMFNTRGLASLGKFLWERALLSVGDYLLPSGRNYSFLINSSTDQASWKRLLRGTGPEVPEARKILQQLWERISEKDPLEKQLDEIIAGATGLDRWQQALVETPEALEYCDAHAIRWNSPQEVYLLKKTQMNGTHAELFTFCIYHNSLKELASDGRLNPLQLMGYQSAIGTEYEPHILLVYEHCEQRLQFRIRVESGSLIIYIKRDSFEDFPDIKKLLIDSVGFQENINYLLRKSSSTDVHNELLRLAHALATTTN